MMRSLYSGVSGLKTHQTKMDVIGNNISNVNTVAYKSQSITFSELMYQTTQKASGPNEATGTAGTNAKQIGLGVKSGAISTAITTQGSTQTTGNAFDLKITGDSFFVVSNGTNNFFTRDGSFYVDSAGNLAMSSTGYNVMGWLPETNAETGEVTIAQKQVKKLQILSDENATSAPQATTKGIITGVIDKNDSNVLTDGKSINVAFYDNLGYSYIANFLMKATDNEGEYILELDDIKDANNDSILAKYGASIYTGTDSTGQAAYASRAKSYTLGDGFKMGGDGTLTLPVAKTIGDTEYTSISPAAFLNTDGSVKEGREKVADYYASAYGFDSWSDMGNLTVQESGQNAPQTTVASMLIGNKLNYTDVDGNNTSLFAADGTMTVAGFSVPAGGGVRVKYSVADGTFTSINGSADNTAFKMFLKPLSETTVGADGATIIGNPFEEIAIDMSTSLNYNNNGTSTITGKNGDSNGYGTGCALGAMTGVSIQNNGMIYGAYDNGQTKLLGQIAVANFSNASGLEKQGDNLYQATLNSGEFDGIGVDITSNGGYMSTGVLEMSNVDLSSEFTEMITTQRGFQANSRIITVSDTLLEELVNLKR